MSRPSGVERSSPRLCLPRFECSRSTWTSEFSIASPLDMRPRIASPRSTCPILMTSAPQSASSAEAAGTKVCSATSRMRTPCMTSGISDGAPFSGRPSVNDVDGHVGVAGDVRHLHAPEAGLVDLEALPAARQLLDRDPALHARERRAEAAVHAVAEPDRDARLALDVELVGALEGARVARRRAGEEEDRMPGGDCAALQLAV